MSVWLDVPSEPVSMTHSISTRDGDGRGASDSEGRDGRIHARERDASIGRGGMSVWCFLVMCFSVGANRHF